MKMHQVSYFLALCKDKNFTRAAERCGVKQPTLTRAIQELEREIGGRLFSRSKTNTELTVLGDLIRPDLARIGRAAAVAKRKAARALAVHFPETQTEQWSQQCAQ